METKKCFYYTVSNRYPGQAILFYKSVISKLVLLFLKAVSDLPFVVQSLKSVPLSFHGVCRTYRRPQNS